LGEGKKTGGDGWGKINLFEKGGRSFYGQGKNLGSPRLTK